MDRQLGDREMARGTPNGLRSYWPCRLRDRGRSQSENLAATYLSGCSSPPPREVRKSVGAKPVFCRCRPLSAGAVPTGFPPADAERVARAADGADAADGVDGWAPRGHISCCFCLKLHELLSEDDQPPEPHSIVRIVHTVRASAPSATLAALSARIAGRRSGWCGRASCSILHISIMRVRRRSGVFLSNEISMPSFLKFAATERR